MHPSARGAFLIAALGFLLPARAGEAALSARQIREQLNFATDMVKSGNWREALFRWQKILQVTPDDPHLLNNVAVAFETMGEYEKAEDTYQRALRADPNRQEIRQNYALFHAFYERYRKAKTAQPQAAAPSPVPADSGADGVKVHADPGHGELHQ